MSLTTVELAAISGLSERRIDTYCRAGVFGHHRNRRPGSGSRRSFELADAHAAAVLGVLGDLGGVLGGRDTMLSTKLAAEIVSVMRAAHGGRWLVIEVDGSVAIFVAPVATCAPGAVIVDIETLHASVMKPGVSA